MRPQTTAGQGRGLAIGALVVLACAMAPLPAATASQGATDQYTEAPPSGPAGNTPAGSTQQSVPSPASSSGGTVENAKPKTTKGHPGASANNRPNPHPAKVGPPAPSGSAGSSDDGGSKLPLIGYPLTTFVAVLLVLALLGLAALAAKLSYGRLWGASRSS